MMVAALYVDAVAGPYVGMTCVDVWGFATKDGSQHDWLSPTRDARQYPGPHPVVAHPPCGPWGRFRNRYKGGEGDADCGISAIQQARRWGGVVEHPAYSTLWDAMELPLPDDGFDDYGGHTVEINQVDFGHPAKKPTWLYVVRAMTPPLPPPGTATACMVRLRRNPHDLPEVPKRHRHITPRALASWLVFTARTVATARLGA